MSPFWIAIIVIAVIAFFLVMIYNNLTNKRILVREAWSGIGTIFATAK